MGSSKLQDMAELLGNWFSPDLRKTVNHGVFKGKNNNMKMCDVMSLVHFEDQVASKELSN